MIVNIREASVEDEPFLLRMLLGVAFPPGDPRPPADRIDDYPMLSRYISGWGRTGDGGAIAELSGPVGAAWYRYFSADEPGYGFVDSDKPELAIHVAEEHRGAGIGRALLEALIALARRRRVEALSLSVSAANPVALRLYQAVGFVQVAGDPGHPTMLLQLEP